MNASTMSRNALVFVLIRLAAIAFLSAPAFALAIPPIFFETHTLIQKSLVDFQLGNRDAALAKLTAAETNIKANPHLFAALDKDAITSLRLRLPSNSGQSAKTFEAILADYRDVLKKADPLNQPKFEFQLLPRPELIFPRSIHSLIRAVPRVFIVKADVRRFSNEFRAGAREPIAAFDEETNRIHIELTGQSKDISYSISQNNAQLIKSWRETPPENRAFVIGARSDAAAVEQLRLARPDLKIVFYLDCDPPCMGETVGAFCGTAGTVYVSTSRDSSLSRFVSLEAVNAAEIHSAGGARTFVAIDGDELRDAFNAAIPDGASVRASLITCGIPSVFDGSPICDQTGLGSSKPPVAPAPIDWREVLRR